MSKIPHSVELKLNSAGFAAQELGEMLPGFMDRRKTLVGLTHYPSAEGPERYVLVITVGVMLAQVAKVFLQELSKDLYGWLKGKIQKVLARKRYPVGLVLVRFEDVDLEIFIEGFESFDDLLRFVELLPDLMEKTDPAQTRDWRAIPAKNNDFIVKKLKD